GWGGGASASPRVGRWACASPRAATAGPGTPCGASPGMAPQYGASAGVPQRTAAGECDPSRGPIGSRLAARPVPAIETVGAEATARHAEEGRAYRITIPPGVAHAFKNTGQSPMIIVAFNTEPHDPANPGVVRDVLIEA